MDPKETTKETSASTAEKELSEVKPPSSERESTGSTADPDNVVLERKHSADTDEDDVKTKKRKLKDDQIKDESHGINEEPAGQKKDDKKEKEENLKSKTSAASPKSTTPHDDQDSEEDSNNLGPKVPPLKIVLPPAEPEQNNRNGKNGSRHHPYVVSSNDDASAAASVVSSTASSPPSPSLATKDRPPSPSLSTAVSTSLGNNTAASTTNSQSVEDQRSQQRVLRSTHSSKSATVSSSGINGTGSSPTEAESSLDDLEQKIKNDFSKIKALIKGKLSENATKAKTEPEEESSKPTVTENKNVCTNHVKEEPSVEVHPRKRKFKAKPEPMDVENDRATAFGSAPHPHEVPVTNCYQMFMDIRRQIDVKRKGLFPIQPKPPQGFKDYLMNRRTYTLQKDSLTRFIRLNAEPPEGLPEVLKEFFQEQESERYTLRMQHIVEKEKLVLSVEQEILRVHGRAARALANQALPFSACTVLKDEEVYNVITPEQEEKDRNARSRYNGRLFISWLQDVDDKWEKIKEEMLARQRKEAESLNAVQKFNWDIKMRELGLWKKRESYPVEPNCVPTLAVNEEFDLIN